MSIEFYRLEKIATGLAIEQLISFNLLSLPNTNGMKDARYVIFPFGNDE